MPYAHQIRKEPTCPKQANTTSKLLNHAVCLLVSRKKATVRYHYHSDYYVHQARTIKIWSVLTAFSVARCLADVAYDSKCRRRLIEGFRYYNLYLKILRTS